MLSNRFSLVICFIQSGVYMGFPCDSVVKNPSAMQEMQILFLGRENPLKESMATYSNILAWKIPWTEGPDKLQSVGSQRVGHDWSNWTQCTYVNPNIPLSKAFKIILYFKWYKYSSHLFVTLLFFQNVFIYLLAVLWGIWDLSSPTRGQSCVSCNGSSEP